MKVIVDAQLPPLLRDVLVQIGVDAVHASDLDQGYLANDSTIANFADNEDRIVFTRDSDFYLSHIVANTPKKLLIISTGNIKNRQLLDLFRANTAKLEEAFQDCNCLEMSVFEIIRR